MVSYLPVWFPLGIDTPAAKTIELDVKEWKATYRSTFSKNPPTPKSTSNQTIQIPLFAPIQLLLQHQEHFVDSHKFSQIKSMCPCSEKDSLYLGW
jgi:hypothetical protein